jgi:periplasmic protein TonB
MKNERITLDDMVFENRNQAYGAYELRKNYRNYLTRAMLFGAGFFLLIFGSAYTYSNYILPKMLNQDKILDLTLQEIDQPEDVTPPEVLPPPPPEKIEAPKLAEEIFLPPEPKIDTEVDIEVPPPTQDVLEHVIISNKKVEGNDVVDAFIPPPPPVEVKVIAIDEPEETKVFTKVEQDPEYVGGLAEMYKYLYANIKYPAAAVRGNISGKVYLRFVVEKDGSIGAVDLTKGIGFGCDEEAIRVIKSMPKWNPGRQNGKAVRVFFSMPVTYKLD